MIIIPRALVPIWYGVPYMAIALAPVIMALDAGPAYRVLTTGHLLIGHVIAAPDTRRHGRRARIGYMCIMPGIAPALISVLTIQ